MNLSELRTLDLRSNHLPISPETLGSSDVRKPPSSPKKIFSYLRELHSGEKRQLGEAKLLLIGQGGVGKTSLLNRLVYDRYDSNQSQTDGLTVSDWSVKVNTTPLRLHVWDFGGQEIYHSTHQFFLTKRSLYILTSNSPVIIVGNKYDEQPLDINRKALRNKYPNIKAILETSCATGYGIAELRNTITREVVQLDDVFNLLPLTWFRVKEQLEGMNEDFISYTRYTGLCYQQNVIDEDNQEQLIELLHDLGLVLNFRDHPILKDTNVLNPDWVTTGIYAVLSDETLKTNTTGILTIADFERILDTKRYPLKRYPYLIELMKEFQLGFLIDGCEPKRFLIPGLLPKEEPEETNLKGDTLNFQYHYRILPEIIISRFIVLMHEDIHNSTYWRNGVMLKYKEGMEIYNIARIKADAEDKKIFIAISGKESTRRSFLLMIRKIINSIHRSFRDLEVSEWVPVPNYPEHPPLDYEEMLGLEKMGEQTYPIGKLGIRINIRHLLDGYEPHTARQRKRTDKPHEESLLEDFPPGITIVNKVYNDNKSQLSQGDSQHIGALINQHGQGNNFIGDYVQGGKTDIQINSKTELTQATDNIRRLFSEFEQSYDKTTHTGQAMIAAKTIEAIESKPTLKKRLINALKEGGAAAIESVIDHPASKPLIALAKGFMDA